MATAATLPDVDIDPQGVFKYILIMVSIPNDSGKFEDKMIVRGYAECPYHCKFFFYLRLRWQLLDTFYVLHLFTISSNYL